MCWGCRKSGCYKPKPDARGGGEEQQLDRTDQGASQTGLIRVLAGVLQKVSEVLTELLMGGEVRSMGAGRC